MHYSKNLNNRYFYKKYILRNPSGYRAFLSGLQRYQKLFISYQCKPTFLQTKNTFNYKINIPLVLNEINVCFWTYWVLTTNAIQNL